MVLWEQYDNGFTMGLYCENNSFINCIVRTMVSHGSLQLIIIAGTLTKFQTSCPIKCTASPTDEDRRASAMMQPAGQTCNFNSCSICVLEWQLFLILVLLTTFRPHLVYDVKLATSPWARLHLTAHHWVTLFSRRTTASNSSSLTTATKSYSKCSSNWRWKRNRMSTSERYIDLLCVDKVKHFGVIPNFASSSQV